MGASPFPTSEVPRLPNIHYLGRRPYETLPAYGKAFTAAIIPYHLTQQVINSNPIKLREYLAMGKPIVSVSTPEIDKFSRLRRDRADARGVSRSGSIARWPRGCRPSSVERQTALAATMTWDANLKK